MLGRLGGAISAELTAIESIERRDDENRRLWYAVAVGFVSAVAIPVGLILAFLGINARQVEVTRSMFSDHYIGIYLIVIAIIVGGAALSLGLYVRHRRDARQHRLAAPRARWIPVREEHQDQRADI